MKDDRLVVGVHSDPRHLSNVEVGSPVVHLDRVRDVFVVVFAHLGLHIFILVQIVRSLGPVSRCIGGRVEPGVGEDLVAELVDKRLQVHDAQLTRLRLHKHGHTRHKQQPQHIVDLEGNVSFVPLSYSWCHSCFSTSDHMVLQKVVKDLISGLEIRMKIYLVKKKF
jgi:hypothetical protein